MDNQTSGRGYTIDKLLAEMEPRYNAYKKTMRECIAGLTDHAARLAAQGQEEQLPMLRRMIVDMTGFWELSETDTTEAFQETTDLYQDAFDRAVSAARDSGCAPELSEQAKADILTGLELYADEMENTGDLGRWVDECDALADQLRTKWGMKTEHTFRQEMGGIM